MNRNKRLIFTLILVFAGLQIVACTPVASTTADESAPAIVEAIEGSDFNRVTVTEHAAERLDIQMGEVREEEVNGTRRLIVPYSSIIYGLNGETWVYISAAPLTFVREVIVIDHIDGDRVVLSEGPPVGTDVATVGVAELYGMDTGVGK